VTRLRAWTVRRDAKELRADRAGIERLLERPAPATGDVENAPVGQDEP
jgi:hypothetical protein